MTTSQGATGQQTLEAIVANFQKTLIPDGIEINTENFPELIKEYVDALMLETGCEKLSAVINTLSLMSSVLQKSLYIPKYASNGKNYGYFQKLYPNLWIVEVNKSGQFKTTSQNNAHEVACTIENAISAAKNALSKLIEVLVEKYENQTPFNLNELNGLPLQDLPGNLGDYTGHLSVASGKQNDSHFRQTIIEIENFVHGCWANHKGVDVKDFYNLPLHLLNRNIFLPTRTTLEALLEHLSVNGGGLILSSEFSNWLAFMSGGMKSLQARSTLTDLYDVPRRYTYATKKEGITSIIEPFISICGALTYSSFKKLITEEDILSGFLARFLLFTPKPTEQKALALPEGKDGQKIYASKRNMLEYLMKVPEEICYSLDEDATTWFKKWHQSLDSFVEEYSKDKSELIEPFFKRWSPYILKIAMLMQFAQDKSANSISGISIYNALLVVNSAFESTKWLIYEYITKSKVEDQIDIVMKFIANHKGSCTYAQLSGSHKIKTEDGGSKKYDEILKILVSNKCVTITPGEKKNDNVITMI